MWSGAGVEVIVEGLALRREADRGEGYILELRRRLGDTAAAGMLFAPAALHVKSGGATDLESRDDGGITDQTLESENILHVRREVR